MFGNKPLNKIHSNSQRPQSLPVGKRKFSKPFHDVPAKKCTYDS